MPAKKGFESFTDRKTWMRGVRHLKRNDRRLSGLIAKQEYKKRELTHDYCGALVSAIIYQQLAGSAASAIERRFMALYGGRLPKPEEFLATGGSRVRSAGISPQKYSYIKDLCERITDGRLGLDGFSSMDDESIIRELDQVRGIGRWTAEMFLMFSLGRTDVLPADDYGFRKAVMRVYGLRKLPDREKLGSISRKWAPYRSIATLCLWQSLK